jgi:hypothetical protein
MFQGICNSFRIDGRREALPGTVRDHGRESEGGKVGFMEKGP